MSLRAERVHKHFGNFAALDDVTLEVEQGELIALLGPSGCGKTTLLRSFAGLETPDRGRLFIDEEDQTGVHPRQRRVGFVFQHYALFRHMSVFENVAFGLRVMPRKSRPAKEEISRRVHELLGLVQLDYQAHKYPHQMSGGERQRVALARSLIVNPRVLLLDEPFGALDANVRRDLRRWLRRLQKEIGVTTILVTHDQEEALEVADRIVLMNEGRIEQIGTPEEIYTTPANSFVYTFIGSVNVFHGRLHGDTFLPNANGSTEGGEKPNMTEVYVRPHDIRVRREQKSDNDIAGTIQGVSFAGSRVRLEVVPEYGGLIEISMPFEEYQAQRYEVGEDVFVKPDNYKVFVGEGI